MATTTETRTYERMLFAAGVFFTVGSIIHTFDHLRRGQGSVTDQVLSLGVAGIAVQSVVATMILSRHRLAPLFAAGAGFPLALGFLAVHFLPDWTVFSDPLWEISSWTWFSFIAEALEIGGALAISTAGVAVIRAKGGLGAFG